MAELDALLHSPAVWAVIATIIFAALAHGTLGFGFPMICTPVVALIADVRTAVLATVVPNIVVNLISIWRGGNWRASLGRYWPVAAWVLLGTIFGTHWLVAADPRLLKLLLALMIGVHLLQGRIRGMDWSRLRHYPHASAALFGLLAGVLSGTVNVTVPPLLIYFVSLGVEPVAMTQALNLCFLVGRTTQAATLGAAGQFGVSTVIETAPLTVITVAALALGFRLQSRLRPEVYRGMLTVILAAMALTLVWQAGGAYFR
jgi:hypothetical protein